MLSSTTASWKDVLWWYGLGFFRWSSSFSNRFSISGSLGVIADRCSCEAGFSCSTDVTTHCDGCSDTSSFGLASCRILYSGCFSLGNAISSDSIGGLLYSSRFRSSSASY